MNKEDIHLSDIQRILFGDAPAIFLLEVCIRTFIIYILSLCFIKLFGKRMSGQISATEMVVMLLIGAIISVPVQFPDRGILQGITLLLVLLLLYTGVNWVSLKKRKAEMLFQGHATMLVKDNVIQLKELKSANISRQQLYCVLRTKKIFNLGDVKRVYLEACGLFSVYEEESSKAGLALLPPDDQTAYAPSIKTLLDTLVCTSCGTTKEHGALSSCSNCKSDNWTNAVIKKDKHE
jgi:uncharacterized membrane protein YcaP (DUF421 family)